VTITPRDLRLCKALKTRRLLARLLEERGEGAALHSRLNKVSQVDEIGE
jgi:hypothetical protein